MAACRYLSLRDSSFIFWILASETDLVDSIWLTNSSTHFSIVETSLIFKGLRDNVSGTIRCFPGTYSAFALNLLRRIKDADIALVLYRDLEC